MPKRRHAMPTSRPPLMRMLHLHEKLSHGLYPNCQQIAMELEVSYKTIQRDIDFMRDQMGLPIDYDKIHHGFYYTEKVTSFSQNQVTEGELLTLFVAQKTLTQYKNTIFENPLRNVLKKLSQELHREGFENHFSFRPFGIPTANLELFDELGQAVLHSVEVRFEYCKLNSTIHEERLVRPYHLSYIDNQWYLFAFDLMRNGMRTFALPRIRLLKVTKTPFKRPANFSPEKLLEKSFGVFSGKAQHQVTIIFDSFAAKLVQEKQWHPSQKIKNQPDGTVLFEMSVSSLHEVERWVLSWKEHALVLEPKSLRKSVAQIVKNLGKRYANS